MAVSFGTIECANCDEQVEIGYEAITDLNDLAYDEQLCKDCLDIWYWLDGILGVDE